MASSSSSSYSSPSSSFTQQPAQAELVDLFGDKFSLGPTTPGTATSTPPLSKIAKGKRKATGNEVDDDLPAPPPKRQATPPPRPQTPPAAGPSNSQEPDSPLSPPPAIIKTPPSFKKTAGLSTSASPPSDTSSDGADNSASSAPSLQPQPQPQPPQPTTTTTPFDPMDWVLTSYYMWSWFVDWMDWSPTTMKEVHLPSHEEIWLCE